MVTSMLGVTDNSAIADDDVIEDVHAE